MAFADRAAAVAIALLLLGACGGGGADGVDGAEKRSECPGGETTAVMAVAPDGTVVDQPTFPAALSLATSPSAGQTWLVLADQPYDYLSFGEKPPGTTTIVIRLTSPTDDPYAVRTYTSADGEVEIQWTVDAAGTTHTADQLGASAEVVVTASSAGELCGTALVSFTGTDSLLQLDATIAAPIQGWIQ